MIDYEMLKSYNEITYGSQEKQHDLEIKMRKNRCPGSPFQERSKEAGPWIPTE